MTLVSARVGVKVTADGLESSFGILECHLLILVVLPDNLLLTLPLLGRCAVTMWL
jgi:hypothetical protein